MASAKMYTAEARKGEKKKGGRNLHKFGFLGGESLPCVASSETHEER